jgi:hypothetical protein
VQALARFSSVSGVAGATDKASTYLQNAQQNDGGWGNVYSTSWAMQASTTLGLAWSKNGKTGLDYLATIQTIDGGVLSLNETLQNRIWATSYAIPAALGLSWSTIMQSVMKEKAKVETSSSDKQESFPIEETKKEEIITPVLEKIATNETKKEIIKTKINTKKVVPVSTEVVAKQESPVVSPTLTASANDSKTNIPTPYIYGGIASILGVSILIRWFSLKK